MATRLLKHQIDNANNEAEIAYLKRCHPKSSVDKIEDKPAPVKIEEIDEPINIYVGELSKQRIAAIDIVCEQYSVTKGTIKEIFCKGADWALGIGRPVDEVRRTLRKGQK